MNKVPSHRSYRMRLLHLKHILTKCYENGALSLCLIFLSSCYILPNADMKTDKTIKLTDSDTQPISELEQIPESGSSESTPELTLSTPELELSLYDEFNFFNSYYWNSINPVITDGKLSSEYTNTAYFVLLDDFQVDLEAINPQQQINTVILGVELKESLSEEHRNSLMMTLDRDTIYPYYLDVVTNREYRENPVTINNFEKVVLRLKCISNICEFFYKEDDNFIKIYEANLGNIEGGTKGKIYFWGYKMEIDSITIKGKIRFEE